MRCKCQICGKVLDTNSAYKLTVNEKNKYFCNEEEYFAQLNAKEKKKADKLRVYSLLCQVMNQEEIRNSILYKEWKLWNSIADDETIGNYLEENFDYISKCLSRISGTEFSRIRYISAILKNNLTDYKKKEESKSITVIEPQQFEFCEVKKPVKNKRISLSDLEDDIDG